MRASYLKTGSAYRPCIRDDCGKVVWQAEIVCCNRNHSTTRGASATDLAKFALEAATNPADIQAALIRQPPDVVRRSEWELANWRARQENYRWALAVSPAIKALIES